MPPKSCHPRSLRVNQLDALFLDSELSQILSSELRGVLRSLPPPLVDRIQPELSAGIRLAFFLLSVARDVPSPGNKLQNLRYQDPRVPHDQHKLAFGQKLGFGITHVVGDWIWNRWSSFIVERGWGGFPIGSAKRAIYVLTRNIETLYRAAAIVNFLAFLLDGKYRTLLDRIFRMRLVHIKPRVGRQVAFDFMNQQLVWHGFSEFLLFFLPLLNLSRLRKALKRILGLNQTSNSDWNQRSMDCGICGQQSLTIPVLSNCRHRFCYYCLEASRLAEPVYRCPKCDEIIESYERI